MTYKHDFAIVMLLLSDKVPDKGFDSLPSNVGI